MNCGADLPAAAANCPACGRARAPAPVLIAGKYRLEKLIGRGGMGSVHLATDLTLDRRCALKVLHSHFASDPELVARFEREGRMLARIEHPNVVPIYAVDRDGSIPFLVMKYLEGKTLSAVLREVGRPWQPRELTTLLRQVCSGLGHMHAMGFVHRDLSPANIFISRQGHVTIFDLGIARDAESELTRPGLPIGTPKYMAPEQTQSGPIDASADVYALGAISFEALTGRLPFYADTPAEMMRAHRETPPPDASTLVPLAPEIGALLQRALAKRPSERFAGAEAFLSAWEKVATLPARAPAVAAPPAETTDPLQAAPAELAAAPSEPIFGLELGAEEATDATAMIPGLSGPTTVNIDGQPQGRSAMLAPLDESDDATTGEVSPELIAAVKQSQAVLPPRPQPERALPPVVQGSLLVHAPPGLLAPPVLHTSPGVHPPAPVASPRPDGRSAATEAQALWPENENTRPTAGAATTPSGLPAEVPTRVKPRRRGWVRPALVVAALALGALAWFARPTGAPPVPAPIVEPPPAPVAAVPAPPPAVVAPPAPTPPAEAEPTVPEGAAKKSGAAHAGLLRVQTTTDGKSSETHISIDGEDRGTTPLTVELPFGKHVVSAARGSGPATVRTVKLTDEKPMLLRFEVP